MRAVFTLRRVRVIAGGAMALFAVGFGGCNPDVPLTVGIFGDGTTQEVMTEISWQYNHDDPAGHNPDPDDLENIHAFVDAPDPGHVVPSDAVTSCATRTYRTPTLDVTEIARPNGSTAGREHLRTSVWAGDGCADIARSSLGPRPICPDPGCDLVSFEYYAYAVEAVGVTTAHAAMLDDSTHPTAPRDLTLTELRNIYDCIWDRWNHGTLGGPDVTIIRYWLPPEADIREVAQGALLGFIDPTTISTPTCPPVIIAPENSGELIESNGHRDNAIAMFSVAKWSAMSQGTLLHDPADPSAPPRPLPDLRFGQELFHLDDDSEATLGPESPVRSLGGGRFEPRYTTPDDPTGPVREGNTRQLDATPAYPGVRYVWNVIDNSSGANSYTPSKRFVGFDNIASPVLVSPLCDGDKAATLLDFGFAPLDRTPDPIHNIPGAACRLW